MLDNDPDLGNYEAYVNAHKWKSIARDAANRIDIQLSGCSFTPTAQGEDTQLPAYISLMTECALRMYTTHLTAIHDDLRKQALAGPDSDLHLEDGSTPSAFTLDRF
jgi:hypothetical protein